MLGLIPRSLQQPQSKFTPLHLDEVSTDWLGQWQQHWYTLWCNDMGMLSAFLALCEGNPPVTGGFHSQSDSNAEICFRCFHCSSSYKVLKKQWSDITGCSSDVTLMDWGIPTWNPHHWSHTDATLRLTFISYSGIPQYSLIVNQIPYNHM